MRLTIVGGCFLEIILDYLYGSGEPQAVLSGVQQGSLLGPLSFRILINDLSDVLKFSELFISADDLKLLFAGETG